MKNILLTGGLGYIGSVLTGFLLDEGYKVTILDNNLYKVNSIANFCFDDNLITVLGDVRDESLVSDLLGKNDIIIPLAALVGAPSCNNDPQTASSVNKDSVGWLLKQKSKSQIIIMPTTNSAYGTGNDNNFCDETSDLNPISLYAKDKVEVENALMQHENVISLRLATVFGMSPRMRLDLLVNDFVYRALNDKFLVVFEGHFKRNYIHVRDICRCFIHSLKNFKTMKNEIYNVGLSDTNISKLELCNEIKKLISDFYFTEAQFTKDPDQRNYIVSNKKIEKTGFQTEVSLRNGINELIKGFKFIDNLKYKNA